MAFTVMYYISIACPAVERTLEMINRYVEHGVTSIQLDMPSADPFGESDFVKGLMAGALEREADYSVYMDAVRTVRRRHPGLAISMVVYPDVIEAIGAEQYVAFLKEIGAQNNMIAGASPEARTLMEREGITCTGFISYLDPEPDIHGYCGSHADKILCLRTRREVEPVHPKWNTWESRVVLARSHGLTNPLYAIAEIATGEQLAERRDAGMQGAILGNALMRLWNDETALWALLAEFQSVAEAKA